MNLWIAMAVLAQFSGATELSPKSAAAYITAAFETHPLVAFSEPGHGVAGTKTFLAALIRHPGFSGRVTDIVIECGNARYQRIADRYFLGQPVARDEVRRIWEDTTIVSGVWQLPMYEEILADIRSFNLTLPKEKRIRVLLGDPPIDWRVVRGPADEDMNDWRDAHFAWVVEHEVMKKGRHALLWIGGAHTSRQVRFPNSLSHLLDTRFPNSMAVVHSVQSSEVSRSVTARLGAWPSMSAIPVRDTWLGRLDVREIGHHLSRGIVEDDLDAIVFWDSKADFSESPRRSVDDRAAAEFKRRRQLADATVPFRGGRIRFDENTAALTTDSQSALNEVVAELRRDIGLKLLVKAFTDAREPDGAQLSLARANTVTHWLIANGVDPARLTPKGCGSSRALWVGDTEQERRANRRAELVRNGPTEDCEPPSSFAFR